QSKQNIVECSQTRSRFCAGALESTPHASPQIDLIAQIERHAEPVRGYRAKPWHLVRRKGFPREARIEAERGQQFASSHARHCSRLVYSRDRRLQFLVGSRCSLLELVEL